MREQLSKDNPVAYSLTGILYAAFNSWVTKLCLNLSLIRCQNARCNLSWPFTVWTCCISCLIFEKKNISHHFSVSHPLTCPWSCYQPTPHQLLCSSAGLSLFLSVCSFLFSNFPGVSICGFLTELCYLVLGFLPTPCQACLRVSEWPPVHDCLVYQWWLSFLNSSLCPLPVSMLKSLFCRLHTYK